MTMIDPELTKILNGLDLHFRTLRLAIANGDEAEVARCLWETGGMCSLSGKRFKDTSVEMEAELKRNPRPAAAPIKRLVGCAACDRGDYQLGHSDECPTKAAPVVPPANKPTAPEEPPPPRVRAEFQQKLF